MGLPLPVLLASAQPARAARAAAVAVACAGGAWLLYRRSRAAAAEKRDRSKTSLCEGSCQTAEPAENPQLRSCVDVALRLHSLTFSKLGEKESVQTAYSEEEDAALESSKVPFKPAVSGGSEPGVETGYSQEAPRGILFEPRPPARRPGRQSALAAAIAFALLLALLLLLVAALLSVELEMRVAAAGAAAASCVLAARHTKRGLCAGLGEPRAAVVRAAVEVPACAAPSVWRGLASWAAARPPAALPSPPGGGDGGGPSAGNGGGEAWQRGFARRGALSVLVEAKLSAGAVAPLTAFVVQPQGGHGGLSIHAYHVPAKPLGLAEAEAGAVARLEDLLGSPVLCSFGGAPASGELRVRDKA